MVQLARAWDYTAVVTPQPSPPPLPELHTARLVLRPLVAADAEDLLQVYSDPRVVRYSDLFLESPEEALACIQQYAESYRQGVGLRWGIHVGSDGKLIGTIGFQGIFLTRAEVAFELAANVWNQGIASEALEAVLRFGMETLGFHRIQAWTHPENEASIHLLLKHGFQEEGRMAQACYLRHRQAWIDIRVFAKLA